MLFSAQCMSSMSWWLSASPCLIKNTALLSSSPCPTKCQSLPLAYLLLPVSYSPPIPLTPTSSLTTSLRRLISWLPSTSMTMVHSEKESSPTLACRTKQWQQCKGKVGRRSGRGSAIIVVDLATGHTSVNNSRKINLQITKISLISLSH